MALPSHRIQDGVVRTISLTLTERCQAENVLGEDILWGNAQNTWVLRQSRSWVVCRDYTFVPQNIMSLLKESMSIVATKLALMIHPIRPPSSLENVERTEYVGLRACRVL